MARHWAFSDQTDLGTFLEELFTEVPGELNTFKGFFIVGIHTVSRNPLRKLRSLAIGTLPSLLRQQQMKADGSVLLLQYVVIMYHESRAERH